MRGGGAPKGAVSDPAAVMLAKTASKLVCDGRAQAAGLRDPQRGASPLGAPHAAFFGLGAVLPGAERVFTRSRRLSPPCSAPRPAIKGSPTYLARTVTE